jgi:hypothetical protein
MYLKLGTVRHRTTLVAVERFDADVVARHSARTEGRSASQRRRSVNRSG